MAPNLTTRYRVGRVRIVTRVNAIATLPTNDAKVARSALRGRLELMGAGGYGTADWATLEVNGPRQLTDARGRSWFEWTATVEVRSAADPRPAPEVPGKQPAPDAPSPRPTVADLGILRRHAS